MPRTIHRLRAFVASPADTMEERDRLERVVTELNRTWADTLSIEIELVRWETHAYPGFETDPQSVINKEIGHDYEIFVGLLWATFGTPTPRAPSGTQEEFERAYERFKTDPDSVSLLFYFKEQPISPSKIKGSDIDRIQSFRAGLGELGGLYWMFETVSDFEALVRPHLARVIQIWKARLEAQAAEATSISDRNKDAASQTRTSPAATNDIESDELGYVEYLEIGQRASSVMTDASGRVTAAMQELGGNVQKRGEALKDVAAKPDLMSARTVADDTAADLRVFAKKINAEIPVFSDAYADVLRASSGAASIAIESSEDNEQVARVLSQVEALRGALEGSKGQLLTFAGQLRAMPRMTSQLNRAKHQALGALESLDAVLKKGQSNSIVIEDSIRKLLVKNSG